MSRTCPGNAPLPWFAPYLRQRVDTPHFLDILFPATSWNLNRETMATRGGRVLEISCVDERAQVQDILGVWETGGGPAFVRRAEGEALVLVSQTGAQSEGVIQDGVVSAKRWNVSGTVSHDRKHIFWWNGAIWRRQ
ncbi:MAG: hypothetical protein HYY95_03515 [Candidatus Rokubacteria bacterium]|nr:hypothetical protein [Candidatus Rokubacteria bacterium]